MKKIAILLGLLMVATQTWALDKGKMEQNIRESLNLTMKQTIVIGDPQPSDFGGLSVVDVSIDKGQYPIYMDTKTTKYFWGQIFDTATSPDATRAARISLTKVHSHGSASAPVTVVEFTDLQCPYCSKAHKSIKESLYKEFKPEQVRLVFKHFPLAMHDWAMKAAVASECAAVQNEQAFWKMADLYYEDQANIKADNIDEKTMGFVDKLKLKKETFQQCVKQESIGQKVNADRAEGNAVGVVGTPAFIVNGRMLRGASYEDLKLVINEKLGSKK